MQPIETTTPLENLFSHAPVLPQNIKNNHEQLFCTIAGDILEKGYSVLPNQLPTELADMMWNYLQDLNNEDFSRAGIGREQQHMLNQFVRKDSIKWIDPTHQAGAYWLGFADQLRIYLNQSLFLNIAEFESHFAHYQPGDYYKLHLDAFKGEANRVLSMVVYLNHNWNIEDGGELVLQLDHDKSPVSPTTIKVTPSFGTMVLFLSEEFPHEVLPAQRDRYSIAGWFRLKDNKIL